MTKIELLYVQKSEKFGQVCALAARELGYGELPTLSVEDRIRVEEEAKQYVEQWEETVEMRTNFTIRPVTPSPTKKPGRAMEQPGLAQRMRADFREGDVTAAKTEAGAD